MKNVLKVLALSLVMIVSVSLTTAQGQNTFTVSANNFFGQKIGGSGTNPSAVTITSNQPFASSSATLTITTINGTQIVAVDSQGNVYTLTASQTLSDIGVFPGCIIQLSPVNNGNNNVVISGTITCN
ncbi:MAG: hypothetical protein JKY33_06500 [Bacteroidia bacterium]|nr:hypothetical protein [Bacteroidia bacterium]